MSSRTPAVVSLLLDRGADLTARDRLGQTPSHKAALNETPAVVSLLLDRGPISRHEPSSARHPCT